MTQISPSWAKTIRPVRVERSMTAGVGRWLALADELGVTEGVGIGDADGSRVAGTGVAAGVGAVVGLAVGATAPQPATRMQAAIAIFCGLTSN
jgi:hypothetical protein